ncbi:MAG: AI-2E family transporter [Candidatus Pacebacteria bacterium]|nr:AI-2E family transporter [Candidatus Paceibacterota bacterium]
MKDIRISFDKYNLFEIFLGALLVFILWKLGNLLLMFGVSLLISIFIEDFIRFGKKYRIPRAASIISFYLFALIILAIILIFVLPIFLRELSSIAMVYPEIHNFFNIKGISLGENVNVNFSEILSGLQDQEIRRQMISGVTQFFGGVVNFLFIFIISLYLSLQEGTVVKTLKIITPLRYEERVIAIWERAQRKIGSWFRGHLLLALLIFVLTFIFLNLLGVPYAFALSFLTAIVEFIPYAVWVIGFLSVSVGAVYQGLWIAVFIAIFYFTLQQLIDLAVLPFVMRKMTGIPSLIVILSLLIGAKLFGFYGLLLAVPLALFVMELVYESEKNKKAKRNLFSHDK